jgi:hypothetical protein
VYRDRHDQHGAAKVQGFGETALSTVLALDASACAVSVNGAKTTKAAKIRHIAFAPATGILGPDFDGREKAGKMGMLLVLMRLDSFNQTRIPLNDKIGVRFVGLTSRSDSRPLLDGTCGRSG